MSNVITHIKSSNRRIWGTNLKIYNILLIVSSVYMPCDTYSSHIVVKTMQNVLTIEKLYLTKLNVIILFVLEILIRALID